MKKRLTHGWEAAKMLDVKELSVRYPYAKYDAVKKVSFKVEDGSFTGLVGESGSGKSTMISAVLGLLPEGSAACGEILFGGRNLLDMDTASLCKIRWRDIALVPQGAMNSFTPVLTIGRHIEEVLEVHSCIGRNDACARIATLMKECGLDEKTAQKYPHELSGGQKQRAAIALALACSPKLLLADEPTTALDVITQLGILKLLLARRRERGLTVLLVTHDLPMAAAVCDRLLVMKDGELVESGTPHEIVASPKHPHTRALVRAML